MILDAYAAFLTALSIPFSTTNGFSVQSPMSLSAWIDVAVSPSGIVILSSYIGLVEEHDPARQLSKTLTTRFRQYRIWPEMYSGYYEIEVERSFAYESVKVLHRRVLAMAEMIEKAYWIGKEMLGDDLGR